MKRPITIVADIGHTSLEIDAGDGCSVGVAAWLLDRPDVLRALLALADHYGGRHRLPTIGATECYQVDVNGEVGIVRIPTNNGPFVVSILLPCGIDRASVPDLDKVEDYVGRARLVGITDTEIEVDLPSLFAHLRRVEVLTTFRNDVIVNVVELDLPDAP
jgi:hypothetical protein